MSVLVVIPARGRSKGIPRKSIRPVAGKPMFSYAIRAALAARGVKAGETLTEDMLIAKRPSHGVSRVYWDDFIGGKAVCDIAEDDLLRWDMLDHSGIDR